MKKRENSGCPRRFEPSILLIFAVFPALLGWLLWGATSHFWAVWAGAIEPNGTNVPAITTAAGAWGDSFGGLNALVGAIGTTAVAATLYLQYRALEAQQIALDEQITDQHLSRFEDNFYKLMTLMRELRAELVYEQTDRFLATGSIYSTPGLKRGHAAIEAAYDEIKHWSFKAHAKKKTIRKHILAGQYESYVHHRFAFCFAPYFRIIYTILNKIKFDDRLNDDQRAYYANILRSQLTSFEIGLMAFNATSKFSKDLKELMTDFRFLKYLPQKRRGVLGEVFDKKAYEART